MTTVQVPYPAQSVPVPALTPPAVPFAVSSSDTVTGGSGSITVPEITPPNVIAAAGTVAYSIQVADAEATLVAAGYTVTAPVVTPPVVTPPVTGWGGAIIGPTGLLDPYWGGVPTPAGALEAGGNWNANYTQSQVAGGILLEATGNYPMWIPYPAGIAGQPSNNGIGVNIEPYTQFSVDVEPETSGAQFAFSTYSVSGTYVGPGAATNDTLIGQVTNSVSPPAGTKTTLTWTLGTLKPASGWIYKIAVQDKNGEASAVFSNAHFH